MDGGVERYCPVSWAGTDGIPPLAVLLSSWKSFFLKSRQKVLVSFMFYSDGKPTISYFLNFRKLQMSVNHKSEIILIKRGTLLPSGLVMETEAFLPGWNAVKNLDRGGLTRKIENVHWNFFYLAGSIKATVIGRNGPAALRRAVKRVLAKREGQSLNSLEITKIVSRWFLVIPFLSITAYSRDLQEGISLVPAKDLVLRMPAVAPDEKLRIKNLAAV